MYSIKVTAVGFPQAIAKLQKVHDIVTNQKDDLALAALHGVASVFESNFNTEGRTSGRGWAALAYSTQRERANLGFGEEHPILVRYGGLEYATSTFLSTATKTAALYSVDPQGKSVGVTITSSPDGISAMAYGEKAANQVGGGPTDVPARPYWFVTARVMQQAKDAGTAWLADAIKKA